MKVLLLWIAKTLRRRKPLVGGARTGREDGVDHLTAGAERATQPPEISWSQSSAPTLVSQSWVLVSNVVTHQSDVSVFSLAVRD
jgi:hypothetical protein